ncbi:MAG: FkbM family methyltransferase [Pseudomonadota bacterium]|nr:FkbM family methyltransferase [Pseudomonadota bacterium]
MASNFASRLGYRLIRSGLRLPLPHFARNFIDKAQLADLLRAYRINCVLDVGANKGWFSASLRPLGFDGDIFSFEPIGADHQAIAALSRDDPKWTAFNFALGDKEETREFNIVEARDRETVLSSFLSARGAIGEATRKEKVEIRTIDGIYSSLPFSSKEPRILLKTDTQGYDINVVRGAAQTMDRVKLLQAEIAVGHIYEGAPHYTEALSLFESLGFRLIDLHLLRRKKDGTVLEYDCVMGKPGA